ncbi:TetR/AcrR family transcriptional regulator [Amycolatopsis pithecellobii]|uniref:TetR family transcriptional regulator n=1 Tax=Amycolatopsis pithecellobii TaxID=664692 RepID=A0A6N7YUM8_9PSEU|nr:TetR/AcrR family transcriptional regulator [Amycolatopsis pithecellobii]MTD52563.1 TetR family transcriptional regulator [Amycolatopsis pithecellobii]
MGDDKAGVKQRILRAAAQLLESGGTEAVSTRAVAAAAGVQAPALYRFFGDKDGLLAGLAAFGFEKYLGEKHGLRLTDDPVDDLHRGWDLHVDFGLRHPAFYVLMYGTAHPGRRPPAAEQAAAVLVKLLGRAAEAGRLCVAPEVAALTVHAATTGATLALIGEDETTRDISVSHRLRDTVIGSIVTDSPASPVSDLPSLALALDAALGTMDAAGSPLRAAEIVLLRDWLHRLAG